MNQKVNILVVDDIPDNLFVIENILDDPMLNVVKASSGNEALGLMLDYDFATVLLDVQMPEMDGFETAEIMKLSDKTKHIPIIFVTAIHKEKSSIFKGYEVGAVDYMFKPIDPIILRSKVNVFIDMYLQKEEIKRQSVLLEQKVRELTNLREANWKFKTLSIVDELTGIANRRSFNQNLDIGWTQCTRNKSCLSLIMIDIDLFKAYNDAYGHLKGDECIAKVAKSMQEAIVEDGFHVYRYGGEEFAVILPNVENVEALRIAEMLRQKVDSLHIPHKHSTVAEHVTISIGVSTIIPNYKSLSDVFIESADNAMYKAKNEGRNGVVSVSYT